MAYPYKKFGQKSAPKADSAANKYKNYQWGTIAVTVQPGKGNDILTKQPYKIINLYNIDANSAKAIVEKLNDKSKQRVSKTAWIDRNEPTHILIKVLDSEIDAWLDGGDLNAIQSVLLHSGQYNQDEVMHLEDEISIGFSSKDKNSIKAIHDAAGENSMEMWQKYLSTIQDPVTLAQIKLYSRVYGNTSYGHVLSVKNAMLIRLYDKDATFVMAPNKWKTLFGRGIKRGAKPLPMYVWVPDKSKVSSQDLELAKNDNGWEGVESSDLSAQVINDLQMKASKGTGIVIRRVGYDVRDTYLLSGAKEDKWSTEIGLLNNLNGELNSAAIQDKQKRNLDKPSVEGGDEMRARTEKACAWMEQFCQQNGYSTQTSYQDASNKLADYLISYCTVGATKKANILSENNIKTYAENATQITLILTKLGWDALSRFHSTYEYSKQEASALMSVVFFIARQLEENSVITEGIFSALKDKVAFAKLFLKALKQIGCSIVNKPAVPEMNESKIDAFKQNFQETFDRINKNYFYGDRSRQI